MKTPISLKVLFICHGNAGRSQIAEAYYNNFTHTSDASSAGISTTTSPIWKTLPSEILQVMKEENIDLSKCEAKLVTKEMVNGSDKLVILCEKEVCPGFVLKHPSVYFWEVDDPYDVSNEKLHEIRDEIKLRVYKMLRIYP